jgi:hypothetical protein
MVCCVDRGNLVTNPTLTHVPGARYPPPPRPRHRRPPPPQRLRRRRLQAPDPFVFYSCLAAWVLSTIAVPQMVQILKTRHF